jgi:hypothetical protein
MPRSSPLSQPFSRPLSRLSLAVLLVAVLGSVAWAKPKVAILGLEATSTGAVDPKDAANAGMLTEALRAIPRNNIGKYEIAPNSNRELQDERLMGNCDNEKPTCMAPIGKGLGADFLLYGKVERSPEKKDSYKVTLQLLNVSTAKKVVDDEVSWVPISIFTAGGEATKEAAREWAQKIYAKMTGDKAPVTPGGGGSGRVETGPGKLVLTGNVPSGDVFVDASKKGRLEGGTITLTLPEGSHEVAIEAPGHKRYEATVTIKAGQEKKLEAVLEEVVGTPPPPIVKKSNRTPFKIAGYSLGGVGALAGAYWLYLTIAGPERDYEQIEAFPQSAPGMPVLDADIGDCKNSALRDPANDPMGKANLAFDKACSANTQRYISGAVGIAAGVLAAGALYFAYRSEGKTSEKSATVGRRQRRQMTVTPVISPSGGGATIRFDW